MDWFFGFKLHIIVNEHGEILNAIVTPGNIDHRKPIPDLLSDVFGKIFAEQGYSAERGVYLQILKNSICSLVDIKLILRQFFSDGSFHFLPPMFYGVKIGRIGG